MPVANLALIFAPTFPPSGKGNCEKFEMMSRVYQLSQGGPKGYVYILFECEKSVKELLKQCTHDYSNGGEYYYKMSSKRMRCKEVQVWDAMMSRYEVE